MRTIKLHIFRSLYLLVHPGDSPIWAACALATCTALGYVLARILILN